MNVAIGVAVVVLVLALIGRFAADPVRRYLRHQQEREHLEFVAADEPDAIADVKVGPLAKRLKAAGLSGPPEAYLFAVSVLTGVVSLILLRVLPEFPLAAAIGGILTLYLPWAVLNELVRRRARQLEHQLIDAIDLTAGTLQAGGNLPQALRGAASASRQPLRAEFDEAFRGLSLGMPIDRAFGGIAERYASEGLRLFSVTLAAKDRAGGDLAPVLRSLNETLRDAWKQQRQVRAQLAGARLTALGVVVLPYVLALVLGKLQPGWFAVLFANPIGPTLLFVAVMLQLAGVLWLWRILVSEF